MYTSTMVKKTDIHDICLCMPLDGQSLIKLTLYRFIVH